MQQEAGTGEVVIRAVLRLVAQPPLKPIEYVEESVRWLTGGYGTVEGYGGLPRLAGRHAAAGQGKRGIEVWPEGCLAGYLGPDADAGPRTGSLTITHLDAGP